MFLASFAVFAFILLALLRGEHLVADFLEHLPHLIAGALTLSGRNVLIFSLDTASDRMRQVLQKVRDQALAAEQREEKERKDREAR